MTTSKNCIESVLHVYQGTLHTSQTLENYALHASHYRKPRDIMCYLNLVFKPRSFDQKQNKL